MHMRIRYHFLADYTQRLCYVHLVLVEDFDFKKSVPSKHDLCLSVWCPTFQPARAQPSVLFGERARKKEKPLSPRHSIPALPTVFGRSKNKTVSKASCERSFSSELSGIARTSVGY